MEYTATAFAEPLRRVFAELYRPTEDLTIDFHPESSYFVQSTHYHSEIVPWFERYLYAPPVAAAVGAWAERTRALQSGSVHVYLTYLVVALVALLVIVAMERLSMGWLVELGQAVLALLLAPGLVGVVRWLKARLQNRRGAPPWQPYRDLRKLFGKEVVVSAQRLLDLPDRRRIVVFGSTAAVDVPGAVPGGAAGLRRGGRPARRSSTCCCSAPSSWRWPGSTPARRSAGWARAAR